MGSLFGGLSQSIFSMASVNKRPCSCAHDSFVEVFFGEGVDSFILASFDLMIFYSREFVKELVVKTSMIR